MCLVGAYFPNRRPSSLRVRYEHAQMPRRHGFLEHGPLPAAFLLGEHGRPHVSVHRRLQLVGVFPVVAFEVDRHGRERAFFAHVELEPFGEMSAARAPARRSIAIRRMLLEISLIDFRRRGGHLGACEQIHVLREKVLALRANAERTSVQEQFRTVATRIDIHRHALPLAALPVPVRQDVDRLVLRVPVAAVEVVAVLGNARQIDYSEVRRARLLGERRRFTKIVNARPHEFSAHVAVLLHVVELNVRDIWTRVVVVGIHLELVVREVALAVRRWIQVESVRTEG